MTNKYNITIDALISIKHINNMLENNNQYIHKIPLIEAKEHILHVLHFHNVKTWEQLVNASTWEEEQSRIDFYIKLYELAEQGRLSMFTKKGGDNNER